MLSITVTVAKRCIKCKESLQYSTLACVVSSNRAAAFLALELWQDALGDAERARVLAEAALKRSPKTAGPAYVKTFAQKGAALMGAHNHLVSSQTSLKGRMA